jgi:Fe-S-cluster containining protein
VLTEKRKSELCLQCLECCKVLLFIMDFNVMVAKFYTTHGCTIHKVGEQQMYIEVPRMCQHLTAFGCSIYPVRPEACRLYDGGTHAIIKTRCLWNKEK